MQRIINGLLYDTKKAELIYQDDYTKRRYYKTSKGNYFTVFADGQMAESTEEHIKDILGEKDTDKYVELFGEVEEA